MTTPRGKFVQIAEARRKREEATRKDASGAPESILSHFSDRGQAARGMPPPENLATT